MSGLQSRSQIAEMNAATGLDFTGLSVDQIDRAFVIFNIVLELWGDNPTLCKSYGHKSGEGLAKEHVIPFLTWAKS